MKIRIKKTKIYSWLATIICLIYILARPVASQYTNNLIKYLFMLVAAVGICEAFINKKVSRIIDGRYFLLFLFWAIFVCMNSMTNGGIELFCIAFQNYIFLMFPVVTVPIVFDHISWEKVLAFLTYFGCIDSVISLIEFATNNVVFPVGDTIQMVRQYNGSIRTYGLNGNYFILAEILSLCGFAAFCLYKYEHRRKFLLHFLLISVGLLSTGTRGYYVAYFIGLLYLYLSDNVEGLRIKKFVTIFLLIFAGVVFTYIILVSQIHFGISSIDLVLDRIRNIFNWSNDSANLNRIRIWKESIEKWKDHPIFGYGCGSTDERYSRYSGVTESGLLRRLVEMGIVGTILQYTTIFVPYFACMRFYHHSPKKDYMFLFFSAFIISAFVEDMILQMYGGIEFTFLIWTGIGYMLTSASKRFKYK